MLLAQLAQKRVVTDALRSHAGTHRIDARHVAGDRHLGAQPRLPGDCPDLNRAGLDLRHLGLQQPPHEEPAGPGDLNLGLGAVPLRVQDHDCERPAGTKLLAGDLLFGRQDSFGAAPQVQVDGPGLDPVDDAVCQLAAVLGHLLQGSIPLQVANVAQDRLLRGLGGQPGEILSGQGADVLGSLRIHLASLDVERRAAGVDPDRDIAGRVEGSSVSVRERLLDCP